jgi:LacI family transcriptional regulator
VRIAMLFPELTALNREIIRGVRAFARGQPSWHMRVETVPRYEGIPPHLAKQADGFIVHHGAPHLLTEQGRPVVNVNQIDEPGAWAVVTSDHQAIGRLAANYLLERGYRSFGVIGRQRRGITQAQRFGAFSEVVRAAGFPVAAFDLSQQRGERLEEAGRRSLAAWLEGLEMPVAALAFNDRVALEVLDVCDEYQIEVPQRLAILGVQNDDLWCEMSHVTLSSVALNGQKIGYTAASALAAMLRGESYRTLSRLIPPTGVVTRESTNTWAVDDPVISQSLQYISEHILDDSLPDDLPTVVQMSRRSLERRFKQALGRSISEEIRRNRLGRAKAMLVETNEDTTQIAAQCGFGSREYFSQVFKQHVGCSPGAYRDNHRI